MPELPEVETTVRAIRPFLLNNTITNLTVREHQLRWKITPNLEKILANEIVLEVQRKAKYILISLKNGTIIIHLGMSGSLRIHQDDMPAPTRHDHFDICFNEICTLRYRDPRKFGALLWTTQPIGEHRLMSHLGPDPLSEKWTAEYLYQTTRSKTAPIKSFLMNNKHVVGIGNIYASEILFSAKIHPLAVTKNLTKNQCELIVQSSLEILQQAILQGGTTLKDFQQPTGQPGYFALKMHVYAREREACTHCQTPIKNIKIAHRSTYFCPTCQNLP